MKTSWTHVDGRRWTLSFEPDAEDHLTSPRPPRLQLLTTTATIELPFSVQEPHPDLLALLAFGITWPWTARRLSFDRPVSAPFAEALDMMGIEATPHGSDARHAGGRASLAYSSGTDSIASSVVLPDATDLVHLRRVKHPRVVDRMTHIQTAVIEGLARRTLDHGRRTHVVKTDLEYVCYPHCTFPAWWAIAAGNILLADHFGSGAVAFGTILEARYLRDGTRWAGRDRVRNMHRLFESVGLPFLRPVAGLTEVGTTVLAATSPFAPYARSCVLGTPQGPCWNCEKCLRKGLITSAVTSTRLPTQLRRSLQHNAALRRRFVGAPPFRLQNTLEYSLARVDVSGTCLEQTRQQLAPTLDGTRWVERIYTPALDDEVPQPFRAEVEQKLRRVLEPMSDTDVRTVETWDARSRGGATVSG